MNTLLYVATLLFWGCSWLAIKWQQGVVPVPQSIFYRFFLAATILMLVLLLSRKLQRTSLRDHGFFVLQGLCLFSCNFILFYHATGYIASGLVALVMSSVTLFNPLLNRWCWGQSPGRQYTWGALTGIAGLLLVFAPELAAQGLSSRTLTGVGLALAATWIFSIGNMIGVRHARRGLGALTATAWSMCYGCVILLLMVLNTTDRWQFDWQFQYLGALLYLAVFASVLGFTLYLSLVNRIGPNHAAYALVATPVLALALSSVFEGYQWTLSAVVGLLLVLLGNVVVLGQRSARTDKQPATTAVE